MAARPAAEARGKETPSAQLLGEERGKTVEQLSKSLSAQAREHKLLHVGAFCCIAAWFQLKSGQVIENEKLCTAL